MTIVSMSLFWIRVQKVIGFLNRVWSRPSVCVRQILVSLLMFPLFVRFYEQKLISSQWHHTASSRGGVWPSSLSCCVWLTNVSLAATLTFMGDWACRVIFTVSLLLLSTSCHCLQITDLKEGGIIFQSEAAMCLIPFLVWLAAINLWARTRYWSNVLLLPYFQLFVMNRFFLSPLMSFFYVTQSHIL